MANRDMKDVKRFVNGVSKEVGQKAYNGGGSSGGSVIVDALPAQGVEGTTYLLRKSKDDSFECHLYFDLTGEMAYIVSENDANSLFYDEVDAKLNFNQDESGLVKKDLFIGNWYT